MATSGLAGIDDCSSGPGSCGPYPGNGCGINCDNNNFQCAWPNFPECKGIYCTKQPSLPSKAGCGATLFFTSGCNSIQASAIIRDCGPNPGCNSLRLLPAQWQLPAAHCLPQHCRLHGFVRVLQPH